MTTAPAAHVKMWTNGALTRRVFVTGATGHLGRALVPALLARGHAVAALVRRGRHGALPAGCEAVTGDALEPASYRERVAAADTFVHLVGVAHPSPAKARQFVAVDLASVHAALDAARTTGMAHFVYVSVAQPAPVMRAYVAARARAEAAICASGMAATILRPWYVLGPGRRWPLALLPAYWLAERIPRTRGAALRLGLVTREQMIAALVAAVEAPARGVRIVDVPGIRSASSP